MGLPRIAYNSLIHTAGAVLVPSSEETALPRSFLLNPRTSARLRFRYGWTVKAGENDGIDFDMDGAPGGTISATIAPGWYPTPTLYAAAVVAALEAALAGPVWACSRSSNKFVISADVPFQLLFGSGNPSLDHSAHPDLGFARDDTDFLTSHTAAVETYQSRHSVNVDLGAAAAFAAALVRGDNLSATGAARLDADAATMIGQGLDATVDATAAMSSTGVTYLSTETLRYLRLVLDDVQNGEGYGELGVWFVGPYLELPGFAVDVRDAREELSEIGYAIGGAHHTVRRATRKEWGLRAHKIDAAKKTELETFLDYVQAGGAFFFDFDGTGANVRYVFLSEGIAFESQETDPVTWAASLVLREVKG